ncbi:MAG: glycosyltransferase [Bacteroidales bacterium]|nr:glycosyltransferase [Bacteroidales bacterium]
MDIYESLPETLPLVSIVTVVRNGVKTLQRTISSIANQTYKNIEFIIIDGNSSDGTVDIIKRNEHLIDHWISEPDAGIYDAMNKGIKIAKGDWINFMNSDDEFLSPNTLSNIFHSTISPTISIVYGDLIAYDQANLLELKVKAKKIKDIWKRMCFSHQACFVKGNVMRANNFNLNFTLAADYYLMLSLFKSGHEFLYIPEPFAKTSILGKSYSNPITIIETRIISLSFDDSVKNRIYQSGYTLFTILKGKIMKVFGIKLTSSFRKIKWIISR